MDSAYKYWILDILSIEFPLVELRIPKPRIPDSTSKIFPDSGIAGLPYIVTWGENSSSLFTPSASLINKTRECRCLPPFLQSLYLSFSSLYRNCLFIFFNLPDAYHTMVRREAILETTVRVFPVLCTTLIQRHNMKLACAANSFSFRLSH